MAFSFLCTSPYAQGSTNTRLIIWHECMYSTHTPFSCSPVILRIVRLSPHPLLIPVRRFALWTRAGDLTRRSRLPDITAPVAGQHLPRYSWDYYPVTFRARSAFCIGVSHPYMAAIRAHYFYLHDY